MRYDKKEKLDIYIYYCLQRTIERSRRGGKGHHFSGDAAGSYYCSFKTGDFVRDGGSYRIAALLGFFFF